MEKKSWYIFYTYPRAERKAHQWLVERGYEVLLPIEEKVSYWKNRQRKVTYYPIFPSYIFVRISPCKIYSVLQNPKLVRCISFDSTPSVLSDNDIYLIRNLMEPGNDSFIEKDSSIGSRVKIIIGIFKGYEGTLLNYRERKRVRIHLDSIPYAVSVYADEDIIQII